MSKLWQATGGGLLRSSGSLWCSGVLVAAGYRHPRSGVRSVAVAPWPWLRGSVAEPWHRGRTALPPRCTRRPGSVPLVCGVDPSTS